MHNGDSYTFTKTLYAPHTEGFYALGGGTYHSGFFGETYRSPIEVRTHIDEGDDTSNSILLTILAVLIAWFVFWFARRLRSVFGMRRDD